MPETRNNKESTQI